MVLGGPLEELRALGAGHAPGEVEDEQVVADHPGEQERPDGVQARPGVQQREGPLVLLEDVEVAAARRAGRVQGVPTAQPYALAGQDGDPPGRQQGVVGDRHLLVAAVREGQPLRRPQVAAQQAVPAVRGGAEQSGAVQWTGHPGARLGQQVLGAARPLAAAVVAGVAEQQDVHPAGLRQAVGEVPERLGRRQVVAVQEEQVLTGGVRGAGVPGPADADGGVQTEDADARVPGRVGVRQVGGRVGRAVDDQDDLEVAEGLGEQRVEALRQLFLLVVGGEHDTDER